MLRAHLIARILPEYIDVRLSGGSISCARLPASCLGNEILGQENPRLVREPGVRADRRVRFTRRLVALHARTGTLEARRKDERHRPAPSRASR